MIPKLFANHLKRLDKDLSVSLDRARARYVVQRRDRSGALREILVITTPDGEFSRPTYEHIALLYQMDMLQNPELIKSIDEHNARLDKARDEEFSRMVRETVNRFTRTKYY